MVITATIDRFEGEIAVLLVGEEESPVNVSRYDLPDGAWSAPGWPATVYLRYNSSPVSE
jgi:hypothetical protein